MDQVTAPTALVVKAHDEVEFSVNESRYFEYDFDFGKLERADLTGYDHKQAWDVAIRYQDIRRAIHVSDFHKSKLRERAIQGVISRARRLMSHPQIPKVPSSLNYDEWVNSGQDSEIEMDSLVEQLAGKSGPAVDPTQLRFEGAKERDFHLIVLLDVSMSMKGEKIASLALAASTLASVFPLERLSLLGFDSKLRWVKRFGEKMDIEELIGRILDLPSGGFTNMEMAMKEAEAALSTKNQAMRGRPVALLVGDGKFTEGSDPRPFSKFFRRLHVLKIGKDIAGRDILKEIALTGGGLFIESRVESELPRKLYEASRAIVRS